jgi:hypothetical protein
MKQAFNKARQSKQTASIMQEKLRPTVLRTPEKK